MSLDRRGNSTDARFETRMLVDVRKLTNSDFLALRSLT